MTCRMTKKHRPILDLQYILKRRNQEKAVNLSFNELPNKQYQNISPQFLLGQIFAPQDFEFHPQSKNFVFWAYASGNERHIKVYAQNTKNVQF